MFLKRLTTETLMISYIKRMFINIGYQTPTSRPHDHKLRKYLGLKSDFEYLKFYWTHCDNNLQIWTKYTLKRIFKILVQYKTTAKVILVWNLDLRIISVYGLGAMFPTIIHTVVIFMQILPKEMLEHPVHREITPTTYTHGCYLDINLLIIRFIHWL